VIASCGTNGFAERKIGRENLKGEIKGIVSKVRAMVYVCGY
jgi:hypothetical protein